MIIDSGEIKNRSTFMKAVFQLLISRRMNWNTNIVKII